MCFASGLKPCALGLEIVSSSIERRDEGSFDVTGELIMHGVSKEVTLPVTFLGAAGDPWGGTRAGFEIETTIDRKDFGITWNKALDTGGLILGDTVDVTINLEVIKK